MRKNHAMKVNARVYAGVNTCVQHAAQGCGGFNRYAHSAVPNLVAWTIGGLEGMRDWRAWRGTGIGEAGLGRTQQLSSKQWSKAIRTCWYFVRTLMHFAQNYWKICLGRRLGGPKSQKMSPRQGAASKIEDRGVSRLAQGSWKSSPDWPKRGQGEAN